MGFVVFLDIPKIFSRNSSTQTPVSSRIKVKNPNDRSLKSLQTFIFTISDDT